jgi:preprotein translocase subunit Sec61beta
MFWEASQYQSVVSGKIKITGDLVVTANQIADILVKIARWLQPQTNWLDDLRTQMS